MANVRPTDEVRRQRQEQLDGLRERLLHLREVGRLKGDPGWEHYKQYLGGFAKLAATEQRNALAACDHEEGEPWVLVSRLQRARRTEWLAELAVNAIDRNEDEVRALTQKITALELELKVYEDKLRELGEGGEHAAGN